MSLSNPPARATPGRVAVAFLLALVLCAGGVAVAFALIAPFGITTADLTPPAVLSQMVGGSLALHLVPLQGGVAVTPWLIAPVLALPLLGWLAARLLLRKNGGASMVNLTLILTALLILWDLFAGWCLHTGLAG